ncbi:MAG: hypothetical protein ABII39_04105 [Candidatus Micrarchaeota archaeon]
MCNLCEKAKSIPEYAELIAKTNEKDNERMEYSKEISTSFSTIGRTCYSSMRWPVKLIYPMFEARTAYAVPNNYFQNIMLDEEKLGNSFAHGAMRSMFFAGDRLIVFSKTVNFKDGKEFFTSFLLLHLDKSEYKAIVMSGNEIKVTVDTEKPMKNLITGKVDKKRVRFSFINQSVNGRMVSKEQITTSARFRDVYSKYGGGANVKSGSIDMEGYAITVPHFSPHPYMLQLKSQFGYAENTEFQLDVVRYFKEHIAKP